MSRRRVYVRIASAKWAQHTNTNTDDFNVLNNARRDSRATAPRLCVPNACSHIESYAYIYTYAHDACRLSLSADISIQSHIQRAWCNNTRLSSRREDHCRCSRLRGPFVRASIPPRIAHARFSASTRTQQSSSLSLTRFRD